MKVYGITLEQYAEILRIQDGKCAICRKKPSAGKHLNVDHEHGGSVRGLLCHYCNNRLVGRLKNHEAAQRLADYLRDPPAKSVVEGAIAPGRPKKPRQPRTKDRRT